nr:MAG TPA: tRNA 5-methylaminomethyl-2-thiouridine biosynthesis bifunctional protein Fold, oxidase, methyl transferase [Caudoviricetes sp.]
MQSHLLYIIYIVYIHTNVFIYPIHIIYNFSLSKRERFFVLELGVGIGC